MTESQEKIVESLQKELHTYAEFAMKDGKTSYQDVVTIFSFLKIAELKEQVFFLEERIETLESEIDELKNTSDEWDISDDEMEDIEPVS